uniref:Uncharacterized protein n=1 Tax=Cacopsylla melanoneura TaxID=428564 RepID=A0A8D8YKL5_9HEMI
MWAPPRHRTLTLDPRHPSKTQTFPTSPPQTFPPWYRKRPPLFNNNNSHSNKPLSNSGSNSNCSKLSNRLRLSNSNNKISSSSCKNIRKNLKKIFPERKITKS